MDETIKTFFLAMTPVGELRVALPVALAVYKMNAAWAYFVSVLGNLTPIVFILLFLNSVSGFFSKYSGSFRIYFQKYLEKIRRRSNAKIDKYGSFALIMFVAVPLPFTGAWTAAIVAFLFGIRFRTAFCLISLGVIIAGLIVLTLTKLGIWLI